MSSSDHRSNHGEFSGDPKGGRVRAFFAWAEAAALASAFVGLCGWLGHEYNDSLDHEVVVPGVHVAGLDIGGWDRARLHADSGGLSSQLLDSPLALVTGEERLTSSPRALGAFAKLDDAAARALRVGRSGAWVEDLMSRAAAQAGKAIPNPRTAPYGCSVKY